MLKNLARLPEKEITKFERIVTHRFPLEKSMDALQAMEAGSGLKIMLSNGGN